METIHMDITLVIIIIIAIGLIAATFIYGYYSGIKAIKKKLNRLTVREMLVHKREKFNFL